MAKPLDALDLLAHPEKHTIPSVCVLFGDESFLKRQVLLQLRKAVLGGDEGDFSLSTLTGRDAELRDILDELSTGALFGDGRRMVVVDEADELVSRNRAAPKDYAGAPRSGAVLVLDVKTWPSTTRLYKALAESGLQIECKFPPPAKLLKWLASWAKQQHHATLEPAAADMLADSVEAELGLFDQELAKLAAMAGEGGTIKAELVQKAVGGWRTRTTWEMLDAAASGDAREALVQLDRLLLGGEVPVALMGQISATLRRFAAATRVIEQAGAQGKRITLRQALEAAGFKPFVISKAESQLRQIGRVRGSQLYRWLLEADLALKGTSPSPSRARFVLEQLIARLSKAAAPAYGSDNRTAVTS